MYQFPANRCSITTMPLTLVCFCVSQICCSKPSSSSNAITMSQQQQQQQQLPCCSHNNSITICHSSNNAITIYSKFCCSRIKKNWILKNFLMQFFVKLPALTSWKLFCCKVKLWRRTFWLLQKNQVIGSRHMMWNPTLVKIARSILHAEKSRVSTNIRQTT